jgi:putative IMPACT (imprinted ancient) family translation regulator
VVSQDGTVLDEEFAGDVTLTARLRVDHLADFQAALSDLTRGSVKAEIIETEEILMPLGD